MCEVWWYWWWLFDWEDIRIYTAVVHTNRCHLFCLIRSLLKTVWACKACAWLKCPSPVVVVLLHWSLVTCFISQHACLQSLCCRLTAKRILGLCKWFHTSLYAVYLESLCFSERHFPFPFFLQLQLCLLLSPMTTDVFEQICGRTTVVGSDIDTTLWKPATFQKDAGIAVSVLDFRPFFHMVQTDRRIKQVTSCPP